MIDYQKLIETIGLQGYKSWSNLNLDHRQPVNKNEEKEVFSIIDQFCRKNGTRISGIYLYETKEKVLYIGKGNPIFNRVKSHYIESYREVPGDTKDNRWHRFFNKYNGPVTVYLLEVEREIDRRIIELILQQIHNPIFNKFK